jgi:hypothetical protein
MAQTRKRRRRKHRGTQGGRIDRGRRGGRPRSRAEAQARARSKGRRAPRGQRPPTWQGAIVRGAVMAAIFGAVLIVIGRPIGPSIGFAGFMLAFYIPMGFYLDRMLWRRRQRAKVKGG